MEGRQPSCDGIEKNAKQQSIKMTEKHTQIFRTRAKQPTMQFTLNMKQHSARRQRRRLFLLALVLSLMVSKAFGQDTDMDGVNDNIELLEGTDPNDAASTPTDKFVNAVSATSSSIFNGFYEASQTIIADRWFAGTAPGSLLRYRTHDAVFNGASNWLTGTALPQDLTYDLGTDGVDLDGVYMWNYNQTNGFMGEPGIKDFTLEYATVDNPTNFISIGSFSISAADGINPVASQLVSFSAIFNVRFVKVTVTSNHFAGGNGAQTGLAQIGFQGIDTDGDGQLNHVDTDDDGDGIDDILDNCPLIANAGQADADLDGIGDDCDPIVNASLAISAPSAPTTEGEDVTYTITYSNAGTVTLSDADITVNTTGDASATAVVSGSGLTTRTVTLTGISGSNGTFGISIAAGTADNATADGLAVAVGPSTTFEFADADGDGVFDSMDSCPNGISGIPDASDPDLDGDGCKNSEDSDDDGDGVDDAVDNCPLTANADQLNTDGAADGGDVCDEDDDNDGISDAVEVLEGTDPLDVNSTPIDKLFNAVSATASNSGFGTSAALTVSEVGLTTLESGRSQSIQTNAAWQPG